MDNKPCKENDDCQPKLLIRKMQLTYIYDRHMGINTFTKQNMVVVCNHNVLHKNVQVCFERIPPTKELLVKLLLPICLPPHPMFYVIRVNKCYKKKGSFSHGYVIPACPESFLTHPFTPLRRVTRVGGIFEINNHV